MRIIGITTARNEEDIIEAYARHTLKYCNELLVINHGSTDSTLEILQSLQREGLPITVVTDRTLGELQATHMNRLMHMAVHDFAADWVVCVDTDEFIQGPLVEHLRKNWVKDKEQCYRVRLVNYRAHPEDNKSILNPAERINHCEVSELRPAAGKAAKVLFSRALALKKGAYLEKGNHEFLVSGVTVPPEWIDEVHLAHFPLRSPSQFGYKAAIRILQKYRLRIPNSSNDYMEGPYRELRNSFTTFSENFYQSRATWVSSITGEACLARQPAEYLGGELRYTPKQGDIDLLVRNILDMAEELAAISPAEESNQTQPVESPEIILSLCNLDGSDEINRQSYPASSTTFFPLSLSLKGKKIGDRIHFTIRSMMGVIEIGEMVVKYEDGHSHSFKPTEFEALLSVDKNGIKLHNTAFVRILVGMRRIVVTLAGSAIFSHGVPTELTLKARLFTDDQRMALAVYNTQVIRQINSAYTSYEDERARYLLEDELSFSETGDGAFHLRTGWAEPQGWGVWNMGAFSTIALRLKNPCRSKLTGRIQLRRRKGVPVKVSINVDQKTVATVALEDDTLQWVQFEIPAERHGRSAIDLSFLLEAKGSKENENRSLGFGIKRLVVEENSQTAQFLKTCRSLMGILTDGRMPRSR